MKLHPGARVAVDRLGMDELDVARAMAAGQLTSPQAYMNIGLFSIRITGTGAAYRLSLDEYVWRDPSLYLNDHFLARCAGLPVIMSHPKEKTAIDTEEYRGRNVGSVMFAYVKGDEVWAIVRVYDRVASALLAEERLSTSPSVVFKPVDGNRKVRQGDGSTVLIEGKPSLLDHIAICEEGVWDKGGTPAGVLSTANGEKGIMPDDPDDKTRADAESGQKLDKILTAMDNVGKRMDDFGKRMDAVEKKPDARADNEGCPKEMMDSLDEDAAGRKDDDEGEPETLSSMPEETAADKSRKDAARAHWKGRKDTYKKRRADAEVPAALKGNQIPAKDAALPEDLKDALDQDAKTRGDADEGEPEMLEKMDAGARKDAARAHWTGRRDSYRQVRKDAVRPLSARLDDIAKKIPAMLTDAERDRFADAQARADSVYHQFGRSAPRPMDGEAVLDYRRRLAKGVQEHSATWSKIHLATLGEEAFSVAEAQVYNDAVVSAKSPTDVPEDQLREVVTTDTTGRRISTFYGKPGAWMQDFSSPRRRVERFRNAS